MESNREVGWPLGGVGGAVHQAAKENAFHRFGFIPNKSTALITSINGAAFHCSTFPAIVGRLCLFCGFLS